MLTLKQYTDSSFSFQNAAGSGAGGWAATTDVGASNGSHNVTTVVGDKVTLNWSGSALFMYIGTQTNGVNFNITTDGVTKNVFFTCNSQNSFLANTGYRRVLVTIERGLTDGSHTTILQSIAGSGQTSFYINSAIIISGSKLLKTTGRIDLLGDSVTFGAGAYNGNKYVDKLARLLNTYYSRDFILTNRGVSGSGTMTTSGSNVTTMVDQIISTATSGTPPEIITLMFGINDLYANLLCEHPAQLVNNLRTALYLINETFDTSSIKVFLATPPYINPYVNYNSLSVLGGSRQDLNSNYGVTAYKAAVKIIADLDLEFPWLNIAEVNAAFAENAEYLQFNSTSDGGLHPNDSGHALVADTFYRTVINII